MRISPMSLIYFVRFMHFILFIHFMRIKRCVYGETMRRIAAQSKCPGTADDARVPRLSS